MKARYQPFSTFTSGLLLGLAVQTSASAGTTLQIGDSGKTFASTAPRCAPDVVTGQSRPTVQAGLFNPKPGTKATVSLNGQVQDMVYSDSPAIGVSLADGANDVAVSISRKLTDHFRFTVAAGMCQVPDTSGNTFNADHSLEYAASGKSYMTVVPGCALNAAVGHAQPFVNLFDNGSFLLNVSVNGQPLTQLDGMRRTQVPVFLSAGTNVITAANGTISIDAYVRDGGDGYCLLP